MSDDISLVISIISFIIAVIASTPLFCKFFIYHFYKPKLKIFFPSREFSDFIERTEIKWLELKNSPLNIFLKDKKSLKIEIDFILDKPWKLKRNMEKYFVEEGLVGSLKGGFWFRTKSFHLPSYSTMGLIFPFEPQPEECTLGYNIS